MVAFPILAFLAAASVSLVNATPVVREDCTLAASGALKYEVSGALSFANDVLVFGGEDVEAEYYSCAPGQPGGTEGYIYVPSENKCVTINVDTYPFGVELQACDTSDERTYSNFHRTSTYQTYYIGSTGGQNTGCRSGEFGVQIPGIAGSPARLFCGDEDYVLGFIIG